MFVNKNNTGNISGKKLKVYNDVKGRLYGCHTTKTAKIKKKVILHCTTLTFWRCIAEYYHLTFFFIFAVLAV